MANANNFPTDITINILLNLPRKSLVRFKSACKSWHSLIEDDQFTKHYYYLNQIMKALKTERDYSIDDTIIDPPSLISHQLTIKFINSNINGVFLLVVPLPDKILFWNPENLSESASISRGPNTTPFSLGERIYLAKFALPFRAKPSNPSWNKIDYLEVSSMNKKNESWKKMLRVEEPGSVFLKKGKGNTKDFLFFRSDKNGFVVIYDSKTRELNEFGDEIIKSKRKLKEFGIAGTQVSLLIDRTYAEALISSYDTLY
ncbi:putative F-box protein At3g16210 [Solanum pennellii]|uniref:F-box protein At3g16210 n=1 Tax=Solanum pennellii TaxID=28526 RepID=A0ABM1HL93_SOLPN|nr:putative F-box protein At3g16210 [Solanum pennellii]